MEQFRTIDQLEVQGKKVLVRMDLNVPMDGGTVRDMTRITRQIPTIKELRERGAKIIIIAHFGRPKGQYDPTLSLSVLVDPLSATLGGKPVSFGTNCIGIEAQTATRNMQPGDVVLLENLRFHKQEQDNDQEFSNSLAALADIYVNDAFSCSHRCHASVVGVAHKLPAAAGRLMQAELETLGNLFTHPQRPLGAIVGGAKISTKLSILQHLLQKVDWLIIGGAMAHSFLVAQGYNVGKSLYEPDLVPVASKILQQAVTHNCKILLPIDVVVASELVAGIHNYIVDVANIPNDMMALDIGTNSIISMIEAIKSCKTLLWNGPIGAFETSPFDTATVMLARAVAQATKAGTLHSVAGGGDTVAALSHSGLISQFSYLSTAGGAFLEWMEGKTLPGVAALQQSKQAA